MHLSASTSSCVAGPAAEGWGQIRRANTPIPLTWLFSESTGPLLAPRSSALVRDDREEPDVRRQFRRSIGMLGFTANRQRMPGAGGLSIYAQGSEPNLSQSYGRMGDACGDGSYDGGFQWCVWLSR